MQPSRPSIWLPESNRIASGKPGTLQIAAGHGVSIFVEEGAAANTANVAFLPIRAEPETIPFSAVWSPRNQSQPLRNLLALASLVLRQPDG